MSPLEHESTAFKVGYWIGGMLFCLGLIVVADSWAHATRAEILQLVMLCMILDRLTQK